MPFDKDMNVMGLSKSLNNLNWEDQEEIEFYTFQYFAHHMINKSLTDSNNEFYSEEIQYFMEEEIYNNLIEIKGVGNWTIHMFLMFSYGSSNIFPTGDLGFLKAISKLYKVQLPISERKLKLLYKKWSPYSSQATWYLWRSLDPIPVNY